MAGSFALPNRVHRYRRPLPNIGHECSLLGRHEAVESNRVINTGGLNCLTELESAVIAFKFSLQNVKTTPRLQSFRSRER
jgi:hypothetical protein